MHQLWETAELVLDLREYSLPYLVRINNYLVIKIIAESILQEESNLPFKMRNKLAECEQN